MKTLVMFTLAAAMARGCGSDYSSSRSYVWTPPGDDRWLHEEPRRAETRPTTPMIAQAPLIPPPQSMPPIARPPEARKLEPASPIIPEAPPVTVPPPAPRPVEPPPKPVEVAVQPAEPAPKPVERAPVAPPRAQPPKIELSPAQAGPAKLPSKFAKMTMTAIGSSLVFFDQETGNIWAYDNLDEPAILIGKFESFDRPLITEAIKRAYEERAAKKHPAPAAPAVVDKPAPKQRDDRPVADKLNDLPKNLWYNNGENEVKRHAREKWLDENIKPGKEKFTGKLTSVSMVKDGNKGAEVVRARMEVEKVRIWDQELTLYVTATLDNLRPADVMNWQRGQLMILSGEVTEAKPELSQFGGGYFGVEVRLDHAAVDK